MQAERVHKWYGYHAYSLLIQIITSCMCHFGCTGATSLAPAYFGEGSGPVISFIACTGRESHIGECNVGSVGAVNCHHGRDVAVRCQCKE